MRFALIIGLAAIALQGCVVGTAVGVAGDVVEGTAKAGIFTVKTTGKAAGTVLPGGGDKDDERR
jgi:hypothetical protein